MFSFFGGGHGGNPQGDGLSHGNPPIATVQDLRNGQLQTLGQGLSPQPVPTLITFQYDAKIPSQWQWHAGIQKALPWAMAVDVPWGSVRMLPPSGGNLTMLP